MILLSKLHIKHRRSTRIEKATGVVQLLLINLLLPKNIFMYLIIFYSADIPNP